MKPDLLKGLKVVDFTTYAAAPCAGRMLADWGADVIKVESFGGDPMRKFGLNMAATPYSDDENPVWEYENGNKRGIALDLKTEKGMSVMHKLLSEADVYISNVRLGSLQKLGLDYDSLHSKYPKLVIGHLSGYGPVGEDAPRPGFDVISFWSRGGSLVDLSAKGGLPLTAPYAIGDHTCGLAFAAGVLAGVIKAQKTGIGEQILLSLYGTAIWVNSLPIIGTQYEDEYPKSYWKPGQPLTNTYECKDGEWITFCVLQYDRYWDSVCEILNIEDIRHDPNFTTLPVVTSKPEYLEKCVHTIADHMKLQTRDEIAAKLKSADIAFECASHYKDIPVDKQAIENNYVKEFTYRNGNKFMLPMTPIQFGSEEGLDSEPAPLLGEHSVEILKELGYDDAEIKAMMDEKIFIQK